MNEDRYPKQNKSKDNKPIGNTPSFKKPMFCNEDNCDISNFSEDVVTMTGKSWSRFMNIQNRKFTAISCSECNYTEFYRGKSKSCCLLYTSDAADE